MAEDQIKAGSIEELELIDILVSAAALGTATLRLQRGPGNRTFHLASGCVIGLETTGAGESLGGMLLKAGSLAPPVAEALSEEADSGRTEGQLLLEKGLFTEVELEKQMKLWATVLLVECFGWTSGEVSLSEGSPESGVPDPVFSLPLGSLLLKALDKGMSPSRRGELLTPSLGLFVARGGGEGITVEDLALPTWARSLWDSAAGETSLGDLLVEFRDKAEGIDPESVALVLLRTGLLVEGSSPSPPTPAVDEPEPSALVEGSSSSPPTPAVDEPEPSAKVGSSGVDFSELAFGGGSSTATSSATTHGSSTHHKEVLAGASAPLGQVQVVAVSEAVEVGSLSEGGQSVAAAPSPDSGLGDGGLSNLFGGVPGSSGGTSPSSRIAPPRVGNKDGEWAVPEPEVPAAADSEDGAEGEAPGLAFDPGGAPIGPWQEISSDEWDRLTTKDKDRIHALAVELAGMDEAKSYFEWFGVNYEAKEGAIKKGYFKLARRFHPDSLVDEPEVYARVASALFAKVSEAYEVLSEEESRKKYIRKHIFGEKDEDDLAMEQVQQVLAAESSFKNGLQMLTAGKVKDSLRHFKAAVDGYPDEAEYVAYYGYALFRTSVKAEPDRAEEGIKLIEKATELKPMAPKPYHLLGKAYLQRGDGSAAKRWLRKSLKLHADNPEAVRDYRRASDMEAGAGAPRSDSDTEPKKGLKGLFGRFGGKGKKKPEQAEESFNPEDFLVSQKDDS